MLEITNHGKIRELRLARPPVNALNFELVKRLTRSLSEAGTECDAVVLSGRQGIFSAGLDVVELLPLDREAMTNFWTAFFELQEAIACSQIPVVAAITGHSPAGGAVMCLMCDYRVMSRGDYLIGLNETRVGLIIPSLLQNAMSRLVGRRVAEKMLVTGAMINPDDAFEIGLVDALETGYAATIQHAVAWCEALQTLPRNSMLGNRSVARAHYKPEFASSIADSVVSIVNTWFSDETQNVLSTLVAKLKNKN